MHVFKSKTCSFVGIGELDSGFSKGPAYDFWGFH